MFKRLARISCFEQWLKVPLLEAACTYRHHSNDNLPGFRHPVGQGLRPHRALACHWSLSRDGKRLECHWEVVAAGDDRQADTTRPTLPLPSPPLVSQAAVAEPDRVAGERRQLKAGAQSSGEAPIQPIAQAEGPSEAAQVKQA